jgi:hypothetical protein
MDLKLPELKKYAIDNRVEIRFSDSDHEMAINDKGLVKVLSEDKTARVEDVLSAARSFEVSGKGKAQRMGRDELARTISESFKGRGFAKAEHDEE